MRYLVSYLSQLLTPSPGDLIATGTPAGVGFSRKPPVVLQPGHYASREGFDQALTALLEEEAIEFVLLAGYMRVVGPSVVRAFENRILNVHPALLPAFPGAHAVREALDWGTKVTGATVHLVDDQVDHGPVVLQEAVPILDEDDERSLHARIQESARRTGERLWRMPLWKEYEEMMRSDVADLKNAAGIREAGACTAAIFLKRFHSYGLGESHVDALLTGVEELVPDGSVKLGFRAHYPQLETKLTVRGTDTDDTRRKLAPVEREARKRLGNFILSEDDATLEGVVLAGLASRQGSLSIVETFTSGAIAARLAHLPGADKVFCRAVVARALGEVYAAVGLEGASATGELTRETAEAVARAARRQTGATHALAVLIDLDEGADRIDLGGTICLAIATEHEVASRRSRILGGREWVRLGAVEMGLDCLRRYLQNLPVYERIDFEKA